MIDSTAPIATAAELIELAADPFPEFALWVHKIPFLSPERTALIVERLKRYAQRQDNGCIVWTAQRNPKGKGDYGRLNFRLSGGRHCHEFVHRLSWFLKSGEDLPHWKEVAHSCNNPPCFNPAHVNAQRRYFNRADSAHNTNRKKRERAGAAA